MVIGWRSMEGGMSCSRLHIGPWSVERDSFNELSYKGVLSDGFEQCVLIIDGNFIITFLLLVLKKIRKRKTIKPFFIVFSV